MDVIRTRLKAAEALDEGDCEECDHVESSVTGSRLSRLREHVFADLGLPDAEKLKIKSGLLIEISKAIRRLEYNSGAQRPSAWAFPSRKCPIASGRCLTTAKPAYASFAGPIA